MRDRRSQYIAGEVGAALGIEVPPSSAQTCPASRSSIFAGANRPSDIRDQRQNTFRDLDQAAFSISNNTTWVKGRHSVQASAASTRATSRRTATRPGANEFEGPVQLQRLRDRATRSPTSCSGCPTPSVEQRNTRGDQPMDTFSNDWALFVQDDWKISAKLTLFLGLRYEVVGVFVDRNDIFANFVLDDGGHHVVPNAEIAALLPPGAIALGPDDPADSVGVGSGLMNTDRNNFSPRGGLRLSLDSDARPSLRGGFGIFHPTGAAQGARDIMSRNPFRYTSPATARTLQHGFTTGTVSTSQGFGNQGLRLNLESPDIYQYNLTLERELPGEHRRPRQLHRLDDAEAAGDA